SALANKLELFYWREGHKEVDFILRKRDRVIAIEVKSGRKKKETFPGMETFNQEYATYKNLVVGSQGIPLDKFLITPIDHWFQD
ncbi:MAG TPA: DUF4143 domain-containing protein, partial [Gammaproteobacteria bacterium]|nr:DUF4143 domain-containing protein [Gammaproteobacteria bacterium]